DETALTHVQRLLEQQDAQETASVPERVEEPPSAIEQAPTTEFSGQTASLKGPDKFPYGDGEPMPFPLDFFPVSLQEVVQEISTAVNRPPDLAACAMVSAAATAIGRSRQLEPKQDWRISPRLYMGLVCDPGSGKSPALTKVMRPLWRKNGEWADKYAKEKERY